MAATNAAAVDFVIIPLHKETTTRRNKHAIEKPHLVPEQESKVSSREAHSIASMRAARIVLFCLAAFIMASILIFTRGNLVKANAEYAAAQANLERVQSDRVRLESDFNSRFSAGTVEQYAQNQLGMIPRQNHQMTVLGGDGSDEIEIPGFRTTK